MKEKLIFALLMISAVFVAACTSTPEQMEDKIMKTNDTMAEKGKNESMESEAMGKNDSMMEKKNESIAAMEYSGTVLAGASAKLIDFNKADYDKALQSDKIVVLYFYANWCPICRVEVPQLYAAFDELTTDKVIGFRVNYNDDDTDQNEVNLAREFGIGYQHGKVFIRNGQRILKSPESWDKNRYINEIDKALS